MKQLFLNVKDGSMKLLDQPMPAVKENMALVESLYTVVSAGTERGLTSFGGKNLIQKALERPDQVKKVLEKLSTDGIVTTMESAFNKLAEPMPMGYSGVGRVIACGKGVTEVQAGDLVAMVGTAYHCEINRVSRTMLTKVPEELEDYRQDAESATGQFEGRYATRFATAMQRFIEEISTGYSQKEAAYSKMLEQLVQLDGKIRQIEEQIECGKKNLLELETN